MVSVPRAGSEVYSKRKVKQQKKLFLVKREMPLQNKRERSGEVKMPALPVLPPTPERRPKVHNCCAPVAPSREVLKFGRVNLDPNKHH